MKWRRMGQMNRKISQPRERPLNSHCRLSMSHNWKNVNINVMKPGAGERFSTWCQLINLVPTILEFWPNLALSLISYMNSPQKLVPTSRYVGICSPAPDIDLQEVKIKEYNTIE